ncbi:MAG: methylated-DNA--[protein]-cysteine S-methyltransferase [Chloroflexi bacterium]|nr:methylated-DNA--[protein]-cysteine S-methyltransferase [Chloroflexota bacterium]
MDAEYVLWLGHELAALPRASAPAGLVEAAVGRQEPAAVRAGTATVGMLRYHSFATPAGDLHVAYGERGVVRARLGGTGTAFAAELMATRSAPVDYDERPAARVARLVADFFAGKRLPLEAFDLRSQGEFARRVLAQALAIPRGEVRPYAWLARETGHPGASRAVGQALGRNPIPVLIPCHRAVRSDGGLGGYAFGLALKERLLALEGVDMAALAEQARRGTRYVGSQTTHVYCQPTCRHAQRIAPRHRVEFAAAAAAEAAGYRPCQVCRP